MPENYQITEAKEDGADAPDFDRYASYVDDEELVVCDRKNANAWLRSDATTAIEP